MTNNIIFIHQCYIYINNIYICTPIYVVINIQTTKVVGDLAQFMTANNLSHDDVVARADELDFPESVVDFFRGGIVFFFFFCLCQIKLFIYFCLGLGQHPRGQWPEPLRSKVCSYYFFIRFTSINFYFNYKNFYIHQK